VDCGADWLWERGLGCVMNDISPMVISASWSMDFCELVGGFGKCCIFVVE
jgi:hypothetical protein